MTHFHLSLAGRFSLIGLISLSVFISFCNSPDQNQKKDDGQLFPYDLMEPAERYILPLQLREISGLAYHNGKILCVQDEGADIYTFDPETKKVTGSYTFGQKGDFEDIAVVKNTAYLLKSNGNLLEITNFAGESEVSVHDTPLGPQNDTEGVAYHARSNSLLISCKGYPDTGKNNRYKGSKTAYSFDLINHRLSEDPVLVINLRDPAFFSDSIVFKKFRRSAARIPEIDGFQPSGLTINPITGDIYIISSAGRLILIINNEGKVTSYGLLPMNIYTQPEGICFSPTGDLYISNEGRGGNGYILRLTLR